PSPLWLQIELVRLGSKAINNVVDITNYMMLLTAQPSHAYDYDKLRGATLGVRMAQKGEKTTLLNGKSYELAEDDVVIADGEGVIGLAGIMGGGNSEVSSETKNIVIEVANFDMYALRKSSMRHGIFTDALTRFSKGQSYLQNDRVLARIMEMINEYAGSSQASNVFDEPDKSGQLDEVSIHGEIEVSVGFINARLGSELESWQIGGLLRRVNFASYPPENDENALLITAPFWRTDIELPEDVVEEVGRLYGFDKLPRDLPYRSITPSPKNIAIETKRKIRQELSRVGANEVLTYSFVHENIIKRAGQDISQAYKLSNALSPELQLYRLSVLPSLLDKVHMNVKAGHDEFALFEFGKAHRKGDLDNETLPAEHNRLAFVYAAKKSAKVPYFIAKRYVQSISPSVQFIPLIDNEFTEDSAVGQMITPFEPSRAAVIVDGDQIIGVVGEFKQSVRTGFKLPDCTAGFEIDQEYLRSLTPAVYRPLSRFPSIAQDISLRVDGEVSYGKIYDVVTSTINALLNSDMVIEINPVNIYRPDGQTNKTYTFRIKVVNHQRTLTDDNVTEILDKIASTAKEVCGAERA
ncbi:MAG: phenylalanine--tRNA ligase subunit beta, partial [Candidatus Saccharimonadaceae bacterium]